MANTANYNLEKPSGSDYADVAALNRNADKLDAALLGLNTGKADLGTDGKVPVGQLPEMNYDPAGSADTVDTKLTAHTENENNPHGVTAAQVGAAAATHAAQHAAGGSDPVTPGAIGAATADHTHTPESIGASAVVHSHDDLYFTKSQSYSSQTAAMLGLGAQSVPDDALNILNTLVMNGSSRILVKISTVAGSSVAGVSVALDSAVNLSTSPVTNENGVCIISVSAVGQHTVNFSYPFGWIGTTMSKTVTVNSGSLASIIINDVIETPIGQVLTISSASTFRLRPNANFQAFLVGGGGSGAADDGTCAGGGGGGYTKTQSFTAVNGVYTAVIGAGGAAVSASMYSETPGNAGGTTTLTGPSLSVSANGGSGGAANISRTDYGYSTGGDGGSGGGTALQYRSSSSSKFAFAGASNGAGDGSTGIYFVKTVGIGQQSTTRAFGDANGALYGGGGGGAIWWSQYSQVGAGGAGGGGAGAVAGNTNWGPSITATSGINRLGGGGGGAATSISNEDNYGPATSGAGGSGVILIRRAA
ncbi:MAG: hypothetical protein VB071_15175 [Lawsonibacter sp.]|nr:hypothetical protein [Lawsonibacter sp.]